VGFSRASLSFGKQKVGTTSRAQQLILTNAGNAPLSVTAVTTTGDFARTNDCVGGGSLAAGQRCTITVQFTPTNTGTRTGSVTIADNAADLPQSVPLSGIGMSVIAFRRLFASSRCRDLGRVNVLPVI
jgi:hypothetical protein